MPYKKLRKYDSNVHIYEFNPDEERLSLEVGKYGMLERPSSMGAPKPDEIIACRTNAGFYNFDASSEHLGLLITDGLYYSPSDTVFIDLIYSKNKEFEIRKVKKSELVYLQFNSIFSCGSSFSLVQNGKINLENCGFFNHYLYRNPRTAIGQKKNKNIILCVADGRNKYSSGVTGKQLAQIMFDEGCVNAVNFDGGGSSVMVVENRVVSNPSDGYERKVGTAFVVYKKITDNDVSKYPLIRYGSRGTYVELMQRLLNQKGFNAGVEDGIAGNNTINALRSFQKTNSLVVDGLCGKNSWTKLVSS